jgi:hypothetical protein
MGIRERKERRKKIIIDSGIFSGIFGRIRLGFG